MITRKLQNAKNPPRRKKGPNTAVTIVALLAGAAVLVGAIFAIGKASGIIGSDGTENIQKAEQETASADQDGMVAVPNLVGKTEDEAAALLEEEKLGKQMIGEENSTQEREEFLLRISRRNQGRAVYNDQISYQQGTAGNYNSGTFRSDRCGCTADSRGYGTYCNCTERI